MKTDSENSLAGLQASLPIEKGIVDALTPHIAVLDAEGRIVMVNRAWQAFAVANPPCDPATVGVGGNYLDVCDRSKQEGSEAAALFAAEIRAVLAGSRQQFELEFPCHSPEEQRWFLGRVTRFGAGSALRIVVAHENITSRKLAEMTLHESENRYRSLFEFSPLPMWVVDEKTYGFLAVNQAAIEHYGYSEEEFLGMTVLEVLIPEEVPQFLTRFARNYTAVEPGTARHRKKDGTTIEVEIRSHRLYFNGQAARIAAFTDVTERNRANKELENKTREIVTTWESMTDAFFAVDTEWRFTHINSQAAFMWQKQREYLLGKNLWDEFPEAVDTVFYREYHRAVDEQVKVDLEEFSPSFMAWREVHAYPSASGLSVYFRDITERKLAEEALRRSEQGLRTLTEAMPQMVWICKPDGWNIYFNQRWMDYTGLTLEASLGHGWNKPFHPDDKLPAWNAWKHATETGEAYDIECRLQKFDGAYRWFLLRGLPLYDTDDRIVQWFGTCTDIHDRKQAEEERSRVEEALRANELRLRLTLESGRFGTFELDLVTGRYLEISDLARDQFALPPNVEVSMSDFFQRVHPDDIAAMEAIIANAAATQEKRFAADYRTLFPDGSVRWISVHSALTYDAAGLPIQMLGVTHDITERKQVEHSLRKAEREQRLLAARLAEAQAIAKIGSWKTDLSTMALNWSAETYRIFEVDPNPGAPTYQDFLQIVHPEDRAAVDEAFIQSLEQSVPCVIEHRLLLSNDRIKFVEERWQSFKDGAGKLSHVLGTCQDITDRKQAEEERDRFFTLSLDMLAIISSDGYFKRLNPAFEATLGFSNVELMAKPFLEFVHPDDITATLAEVANLESGGHVILFENRYICRDGSYKWMRWMCAPYEGLWYCVAHNITAVKQAEAALRQANDDLESRVLERTAALEASNREMGLARQAADAANKSKSEFLSRMSHELRTPLNAILGFGQILDKEDLTTLQKESIHYIIKGGRHLLNLINEILDIARIEAGQSELSIEPVSVAEVVQESCTLVGPLAALGEIGLLQDLSLQKQTYVLADRQRLKQALINILSNGIKYNCPAGRVEVSCIEGSNDRVCIAVRDTGPGIAPEDLPKLFTPFERLGAANSDIEGTGLGLVVSLQLITAMGGTLEAESQLEQGSTFSIRLPRATSPAVTLADLADRREAEEFRKRPECDFNVLCIEDNLSNLRLLEVILTDRPEVTLLAAMQGSVGLDLARQQRPDLILLDLNLPDMSGKEVLARLQQSALTHDIPVIIISADATTPHREQLLSAGAKAYLTKPLDVAEFLKVLDQNLQAGGGSHVS